MQSAGYIHTLIPGPYVVVLFIDADKALFSIELLLLIWVMKCFDCWSATIKNEKNLLTWQDAL